MSEHLRDDRLHIKCKLPLFRFMLKDQPFHIRKRERSCQSIIHAAFGCIQIRMSCERQDIMLHELLDYAPLIRPKVKLADGLEKKGMVGNHHLSAFTDGKIHILFREVEGNQYLRDPAARIPHLQPRVIP